MHIYLYLICYFARLFICRRNEGTLFINYLLHIIVQLKQQICLIFQARLIMFKIVVGLLENVGLENTP